AGSLCDLSTRLRLREHRRETVFPSCPAQRQAGAAGVELAASAAQFFAALANLRLGMLLTSFPRRDAALALLQVQGERFPLPDGFHMRLPPALLGLYEPAELLRQL